MAEFGVDVDPAEVGFDEQRLRRLDDHFRRYVDDGRLAGWQVMVSRHGTVAHLSSYGFADKENGRAVEPDTIWRIYSMTKPITAVAAMTLVEQGRMRLSDPVSRWLPEFASPQVYVGGPATNPATVPATEPIRVWHLLTHTAGLTYGFHHVHVTDEIYRNAGLDFAMPADGLADFSRRVAALPLAFRPGTEWLYSVATDILGRLVEVVADTTLGDYLREQVFAPLDMVDTGFFVDEARHHRLATLYATAAGLPGPVRYDKVGERYKQPPRWLSGGGGLVSTTRDYTRFTWMLLRGGELDGARLLSPRTLRQMSRNHLPHGADLQTIGRSTHAETRYDGVGFGLGFAVVIDPAATRTPASVGELSWGGAASTAFWVDPAEDLSVVFMTQLIPSSTHPIRPELRQLVYAALVD